MKTKTVILSALLGAAVAGTAVAQTPVYSQNVVGYVNMTLTNGFNLIGNPLDLDGTNQIQTVFGTNLPQGSSVFKWVNGNYVAASYATNKTHPTPAWVSGATLSANPGEGLFIKVPSDVNITFVGNVVQGALVNTNLPAGVGYGLLAYQAPVSDYVTNLNFKPTQGDTILTWVNGVGYNAYSYNTNKTHPTPAWLSGVPKLGVGTGFWLKTGTAGETWTNSFIVQ